MPKLTKRTVDALSPDASRDVFAWDNDLPGFGLRVKSSGAKAFIAQYRNRNGRSRRITIGRYGVLTAEQARTLCKELLADVLRGADPAAARAADRDAMTVAELCREYLDRSARGLIMTRRKLPKKESTLYTDRGRVERHVVPLLGTRTVKDLTGADLRAFLRDVIAGKTRADVKTIARGRAIVKGGKGTATRTMALLSSILTYAVGEGYRADNPARGIELPSYNRKRTRLDANQYRTLGEALDRAERDGECWQFVSTVRLIALSGCRRGEVTALRRAEVDARAQMLRLADSKTGASLRPIGAASLTELEDALARGEGEFVFPAIRCSDAPYGGLPKAWAKHIAPVLPGVTPHILRHGFASVSDDLGFTDATTGAMLGHSGGGTTRAYIHKLDPAL